MRWNITTYRLAMRLGTWQPEMRGVLLADAGGGWLDASPPAGSQTERRSRNLGRNEAKCIGAYLLFYSELVLSRTSYLLGQSTYAISRSTLPRCGSGIERFLCFHDITAFPGSWAVLPTAARVRPLMLVRHAALDEEWTQRRTNSQTAPRKYAVT